MYTFWTQFWVQFQFLKRMKHIIVGGEYMKKTETQYMKKTQTMFNWAVPCTKTNCSLVLDENVTSLQWRGKEAFQLNFEFK